MNLMYWIFGIAGVLIPLAILGGIVPLIGEFLMEIIEAICDSFDD